MENYLKHYGRLGMKWGQHIFGKEKNTASLGRSTILKSKTTNLDKWGKDADHNVLYITGRSGSGKSTIAIALKDRNTDVIHLDLYFDKAGSSAKNQNKKFNKFLTDKGIKLPIVESKQFSEFEKAVDEFGKRQFANGRKVIAEGVQISDSGLWEDKHYYVDKPVMIAQTSNLLSLMRVMQRDNVYKPSAIMSRIEQQKIWDLDVKNLEQTIEAKKGALAVQDILERLS